MKMHLKFTFLIVLFCLFLGCKTSTSNPCDGLMNESPPLRIGLILVDQETGTNFLQKNGLKGEDVKVTNASTGVIASNWRINNIPNSPMDGMLELVMFHEKVGSYGYKIELKDLSIINVSYAITQEKTDDPCKIYRYPISSLKVLNHDFDFFKHENRITPNILVVQLAAK